MTYEMPVRSGWYFVKWTPGEKPDKVFLHVSEPGAREKAGLGVGRFYSWGWSKSDDPEGFTAEDCKEDSTQWAPVE